MQQTSRVDRQERNLQLFHSWGWIKPSAGVVSSTNVEWDSHLKRLFYSWLVTWYVQIILYIELYVSVPAPKFLCQSAIFYLLLICFDTDVSIMLLHFLNAPINWQSHYYFAFFFKISKFKSRWAMWYWIPSHESWSLLWVCFNKFECFVLFRHVVWSF